MSDTTNTTLVPGPSPNLRPPWKAGQSGNSSGKSKQHNELARRARALTLEELPKLQKANAKLMEMLETEKDADKAVAITARIYDNVEMIAQRGYGKVPDVITLEEDNATTRVEGPDLVAGIMELLRDRKRQERMVTVEATTGG